MRPSESLARNRALLHGIVVRHGLSNPRVFGSVLLSEDGAGSDLDILVDTQGSTSLLRLARLEAELEKALQVSVHVTLSRSLPPTWGPAVLADAQPV